MGKGIYYFFILLIIFKNFDIREFRGELSFREFRLIGLLMLLILEGV